MYKGQIICILVILFIASSIFQPKGKERNRQDGFGITDSFRISVAF